MCSQLQQFPRQSICYLLAGSIFLWILAATKEMMASSVRSPASVAVVVSVSTSCSCCQVGTCSTKCQHGAAAVFERNTCGQSRACCGSRQLDALCNVHATVSARPDISRQSLLPLGDASDASCLQKGGGGGGGERLPQPPSSIPCKACFKTCVPTIAPTTYPAINSANPSIAGLRLCFLLSLFLSLPHPRCGVV